METITDNEQERDIFDRLTQLFLLPKLEYQAPIKHIWICSSDLPRRVRNKHGLLLFSRCLIGLD